MRTKLALVALAAAHAAGVRRGRRAERAAVDRYLHDTVLPALEAFALATAGDADRAPEKLAELRRAARAQAAALRRDLLDRRPEPVSALSEGLRSAIAEEERQGLRVDLVADADPVLPSVRGLAVRDAVREVLRNTRKHAGVDRAQVRIVERSGGFAVIAADRGAGFAGTPRGFGIRESIVARMAEVGGAARVESRPGGGTTVTLWVPR
jgi:signal transduction histidine kinase